VFDLAKAGFGGGKVFSGFGESLFHRLARAAGNVDVEHGDVLMKAGRLAAGFVDHRLRAVQPGGGVGEIGRGALEFVQALDRELHHAAFLLKAPASELGQKIAQVQDTVKSLEKELGRLKSKLASSQGDDLAAQAVDVRGIKVLAASLEGADAKSLRETMDKLKDKLKSAIIVLGAVEGGKVQLAAGVTADATSRVKAGDLVNYVAQQVGGKGGGRADMAMAGGTDPSKLTLALASVQAWAEQRL